MPSQHSSEPPTGGSFPWPAVQGTWLDEEGATASIRGTKLHIPNGIELQLLGEGDNMCSFEVGGVHFWGKFSVDSGSIAWNDGTSWSHIENGRGSSTLAVRDVYALEGPALDALRDREVPIRADQTGPATFGYVPRTFEGSKAAATAVARDRVLLLISHAAEDLQMEVELPKRAKFKHVKKVLARSLGTDELLHGSTLLRKDHTLYRPVKDHQHIGDIRQVFVLRVDLGPCSGQRVSLDDSEVSTEEDAAVADGALVSPQGGSGSARGSDDVVRTVAEPFTRDYAVSLQRALLERFQDHSFMQKLKALEVYRDTDAACFAKERQKLLLSVQSLVLPKYGFEGSQSGVHRMMSEWGPFLQDPEFRELTIEINKLLGIDMPPETWERSVENFRRIVATTQPLNRSRIAPGIAARCRAVTGAHIMGMAALRNTALTEDCADVFSQLGTGGSAQVRDAPFRPWPPNRPRPFKLFIAGTRDGYDPDEMRWHEGVFVYSVMIREEGLESFQLLIDGEWERTLYPSIEDANAKEAHAVLGPDNSGHGKNWQIGKAEYARPGTIFTIVAQLDASGVVRFVFWEPQAA